MVHVHTIEMIEHSAHSTPNVMAHADMINGALVGFDYTNKVTTAPSSSSPLYIVLNIQTGDDEYVSEYTISQGEYVNLFKLSNWNYKELDVTVENIVDDIEDISIGDEMTFDSSTFKFKKGTGATTGFYVTAKGTDTITVKILSVD